MNFDNINLIVSGVASSGNEGTINFKIVASDGGYDSASDFFHFVVFNNPPAISTPLANLISGKNASVGEFFSIQAKPFQDIDGPQILSYNAFFQNPDGSLTELTASGNTWLLFSDVSLTFSGTPRYQDLIANNGIYHIMLRAYDGLKYTSDQSLYIQLVLSLDLLSKKSLIIMLVLKFSLKFKELPPIF